MGSFHFKEQGIWDLKGRNTMKQRIFGFIISLLLCAGFLGCSKQEVEFADKEWLFYDEVTSEHLVMYFGSDGTYSYHCQCGEPVGNSDIYENYKYNKDTGIITLFNSYDDSTDEIEIIDSNEYHLMVRVDGEVKDFVLGEMDTRASFFGTESESYLADYNSRCVVVDIQDGKMIYGPNEYDPEGQYKDGPFEEYEMGENVSFFELLITRYISAEDEWEYEESCDVAFTEIDREEVQCILDSGTGTAFVWFDDELKVEKIVLYGQISVTE